MNNLPEIYQIEVSSICNLSCVMCPKQHFPRKNNQSFIDFKIVEPMVDRGEFDNTLFTELQMSGEPLLYPHKRLSDLIDLLKSVGILLGLSTNGHFLEYQESNLLKLDFVTISLDSIRNYTQIRKCRDFPTDINSLLKTIKKFLVKAAEKHISVDIQVIELDGWGDELSYIKEEFQNFPCNIRTFPDAFLSYTNPEKAPKDNSLCLNLWNSVSIQSNGNVVPCCISQGDNLILGNIEEQSLKEIWKGSVLNNLRSSHLRGVLPDICKKCYTKSPFLFHREMIKNRKERSL